MYYLSKRITLTSRHPHYTTVSNGIKRIEKYKGDITRLTTDNFRMIFYLR